MEAIIAIIKNNLQKTSVAISVGVVAGLLIGLIFGWLVWPVQWTDGTPEVLRADLQRDYLRMTIDSYNRTGDVNTAMARWDNLGEAAGSTLIALKSDPGTFFKVKTIEVFAFSAGMLASRCTTKKRVKFSALSSIPSSRICI